MQKTGVDVRAAPLRPWTGYLPGIKMTDGKNTPAGGWARPSASPSGAKDGPLRGYQRRGEPSSPHCD